ncbi:hypothetical protein [Achromobacter sp. AGC39]
MENSQGGSRRSSTYTRDPISWGLETPAGFTTRMTIAPASSDIERAGRVSYPQSYPQAAQSIFGIFGQQPVHNRDGDIFVNNRAEMKKRPAETAAKPFASGKPALPTSTLKSRAAVLFPWENALFPCSRASITPPFPPRLARLIT